MRKIVFTLLAGVAVFATMTEAITLKSSVSTLAEAEATPLGTSCTVNSDCGTDGTFICVSFAGASSLNEKACKCKLTNEKYDTTTHKRTGGSRHYCCNTVADCQKGAAACVKDGSGVGYCSVFEKK
jgi:hypothetical protein